MVESGGKDMASIRAPAVFISYASQDAATAARICNALRQAGVVVWFDQSELRGGDVWDQRIRREIRDCTLFMPIISSNTASRNEGYFRLEWDLADQRSHMMARDRAFIVPVCLDATKEAGTDVPESFHRVQWTRLPDDNTPPAFTARIVALLGAPAAAPSAVESIHDAEKSGHGASPALTLSVTPKSTLRKNRLAIALMATIAAILAYVAVDRPWLSKHTAAEKPPAAVATAPTAATPAIPEKSVAVLPFVDMSEKKDQEYLSDGLSEELIDMLTKVSDLRVPARTSSFYFKGKPTTVADIAKVLGVAHVLEGSVRKSGKHLRITAQLIRANNGYHLWSETYDRTLDDVFKVQDEIATAVVKALKASLLEGSLASTDKPGNAEAHALYLQGRYYANRDTKDDNAKAIAALEQAVSLAPESALYWALLSRAYANQNTDTTLSWNNVRDQALRAADKALALDPKLPEAHIARAKVALFLDLDFPVALAEIAKAQQLDPNDLDVISWSAIVAHLLGHSDEAIRLAERSVTIDPLRADAYNDLSNYNFGAGRYAQAEAAARKALDLNAAMEAAHSTIGLAILLRDGNRDAALAEIAREPDLQARAYTLAVANQIIGNPLEADRWLAEIEPMNRRTDAYDIAILHALRSESGQAVAWLDKAYALRDSGLFGIKTDPFLNSLRSNPRYKVLLRKMNLQE